jgi:hypothetical protein
MSTTLYEIEFDRNVCELSDEEVNAVAGGNALTVAAAAAYVAALNGAEAFGQRIGKALYYATH